MKNTPLISVVIPLYNSDNTIERAIRSVLSQSYRNIEILVVDDGSDDDSLALAKKMEDGRIQCYSLPHQNANVARNFGIHHSCGEYIAMLDADDEWKVNHLESALVTLQMEKVDGVYGSIILRGREDKVILTRRMKDNESTIDFLLSNGYGAQTSTLFMTATSAKDILWNETLKRHQDYDFIVRYCKKYQMCPKVEATTIYHLSFSPKFIDFDSCIRFIRMVEDEITDRLYVNYHLRMLRLAAASSASSDVIQYYRKAAIRYKYLLPFYDYLMLRKPKGKIMALWIKVKYMWSVLCLPLSGKY